MDTIGTWGDGYNTTRGDGYNRNQGGWIQYEPGGGGGGGGGEMDIILDNLMMSVQVT